MALSRNKALFIDISEFSATAAVTNGFGAPMQIEQLVETQVEPGQDLAPFVRSLIDTYR